MSNYTKTVDFAAKDALTTGNPSKLGRGSEVDTEFNNISTAIATKEDTANKGAANGYASLNASTLVPAAQLPAATSSAQGAVELATDAETITGTDTTRACTPANVAAKIANAYTAADVLTKIKTVDGSGSGLDADLLDGNNSSAFAAASHTHAASDITSGLSGTYAPLASPTFTGTPAAPTASTGTQTTQIATTAFVCPSFSHGTNGYDKRASGLIDQWGQSYIGNPDQGDSAQITFPMTFPTACYTVMAYCMDASGNYSTILAGYTYDTTGFYYRIGETAAINQAITIHWHAIGK